MTLRIDIITVGKQKPSPEKEIFDTYLKRITYKTKLTELPPSSKEEEGQRILEKLTPDHVVFVLDERGEDMGSAELARRLEKRLIDGRSLVAFVIGGADGLSQSVRDRADEILSFGKLTWPHMLVRAMLGEQIYRIQQILNNHPYHRA